MFSNFRQCYQVMMDHSKITKMHFWMIQKAKKEFFGHFLEFALLDRLDIVHCDGTKCFLTFDNSTRLGRIIQKLQKCIFEWCKEPIHLVYSQYIEFGLLYRLHIAYFDSSKWSLPFGNGVVHMSHLDHSIITLLQDKTTCFDQFLARFSSLIYRINFILHILIVLNGVHDLVMISCRFRTWIIQW